MAATNLQTSSHGLAFEVGISSLPKCFAAPRTSAQYSYHGLNGRVFCEDPGED